MFLKPLVIRSWQKYITKLLWRPPYEVSSSSGGNQSFILAGSVLPPTQLHSYLNTAIQNDRNVNRQRKLYLQNFDTGNYFCKNQIWKIYRFFFKKIITLVGGARRGRARAPIRRRCCTSARSRGVPAQPTHSLLRTVQQRNTQCPLLGRGLTPQIARSPPIWSGLALGASEIDRTFSNQARILSVRGRDRLARQPRLARLRACGAAPAHPTTDPPFR